MNTTNETKMNEKIRSMKPGDRVVLSSVNGITVAAERSGDGTRLRIIRETVKGFVVIKNVSW